MTEVADIFRMTGEAYRSKHKLTRDEYKAMLSIEVCRSAALGGHIDECNECGYIRISYNSCRNRHCPKCQSLAKEKWLHERAKDLLPIQYFHIVFTIPDILNPLTLKNKEEIYSILFKAIAESLKELSIDPKYLGAQIGFISILHTWGQNLMYHPHVHSIVTGGGLSSDESRWVSSRKDFFLPVKVLSKLFKGKFLYYLKQAYYSRNLKFTQNILNLSRYDEFQNLIDELYKKKWIVYAKPPFRSPKYVLEYLGRYTHRVAISNNRIIKIDENKVTFKWRDYKDNNKIKYMTLDVFEFIRRFLLHILPRRFVKIRHYGILSNKNRNSKLRYCKELLCVAKGNKEKARYEYDTWEELLFHLIGIDITKCPSCNKGKMIRKRKIQSRCFSPPTAKGLIA